MVPLLAVGGGEERIDLLIYYFCAAHQYVIIIIYMRLNWKNDPHPSDTIRVGVGGNDVVATAVGPV